MLSCSCCCSVTWSCLTLFHPMDCSTLGLPVHHHLPEFAQTQVHWVSDAIQPSHSLSPPSLPAFYLSQHQGLFQWLGSSHQVTKVLNLQHQSFQWIFGLIFFRMDCFDLLAVQGTLKSLLEHHSSKASILWCSAFFMVQLSLEVNSSACQEPCAQTDSVHRSTSENFYSWWGMEIESSVGANK